MSLINEMLKNLEKQPRAVVPPIPFVSEKNHISNQWGKQKQHYLVVALLGVCLIVVCIIVHEYKSTLLAVQALPKLKTTATSALPARSVPFKVFNPNRTMLNSIALQVQNDMTSIRLLLNQKTLYQLAGNPDQRDFVIILERTQLLAALPQINYAGSGIENIKAYSDENGHLKLVFRLSPGALVQGLAMHEESKAPELQLDILYKNRTLPAATMPVTIKNPIVQNEADSAYQAALTKAAAGKTDEAIRMAQTLLQQVPSHVQGRELLVTLLIQQKNHIEANKVVDIGLKAEPTNLVFVELKARLLVEAGALGKAVSLLEKIAPPLEEHPEYHAFMAALYQRQGHAILAANLYKQLLVLQPNNSKWWVGLGAALETAGQVSQAQEAYANADSLGGLNPELKAYLNTELRGKNVS